MRPRLEIITPKHPTAVAMEIAALGFLAWQLRNRYFREKDEPSKEEPMEYPLVDAVDDASVYIHPINSESLTIGELSPDGLVEISVERSVDEDGLETLNLHSISTDNEDRLQILKQHLSKLHDVWRERLNANS